MFLTLFFVCMRNKKDQVSELDQTQNDAVASETHSASAAVNDDEVDINLADAEVQKAAVFIQSGFKSFKQRKISQGLAQVALL